LKSLRFSDLLEGRGGRGEIFIEYVGWGRERGGRREMRRRRDFG
jgi:hypothetical protein